MCILNLTQHQPTNEQLREGVVNLPVGEWTLVKELLTFETLPSVAELQARAHDLACIAADMADQADRGDSEGFANFAMIGGAPFFMGHLEKALYDVGVNPIYAFSMRESVEALGDDGVVIKTNVFKHIGWVAPY